MSLEIDKVNNDSSNNNNNQLSFVDVIIQLENLNGVYFGSYKEKFQWTDQLKRLSLMYNEVSSIAHKFDFSPSHTYNGLRSFLKMVDVYFAELSKTMNQLHSDPGEPRYLMKLKLHQSHSFAILSMGETMSKINKIYSESDSFDSPVNENFVAEAQEILIQSVQRHNSCNRLIFFPRQPEWFRSQFKHLMRLLYFVTTPLSKSIYGLFSRNTPSEYYSNRVANYTPALTRANINKLLDGWVFRLYIWVTNLINYNFEVSDVNLYDRQSDWVINEKSQSIERCNSHQVTTETKAVKCVLVKPRGYTGDKLILFIHGGGFTMGASIFYLSTFRNMVNKSGAALLSVDYSLSPAAKYPMALQECLDVYLNLHSSNPITGFKANKIVLAGDSAGGNLIIATTIAIAEIRHLQMSSRQPPIPLPLAVNAVYPLISCLGAHLYPSRVLMDFCIPSIYVSIANAYLGSFDEGKYYREGRGRWHENTQLLRKTASEVNWRFNDPFLHLPGYKHFDRLKNVPLYVQSSEFDSILDDSIAIAKCWKGPVTLDILPEVTHAWMSFAKFAPSDFAGRTLVQDRIREAFDREPVEDNNNEG